MGEREIATGHSVAAAMMICLQHADAHAGVVIIAGLLEPVDLVVLGVSRQPHRKGRGVRSDDFHRGGAVVRTFAIWEWCQDVELCAAAHCDRADRSTYGAWDF